MSAGRPERVALVPARGGSKRIPRKNVMTFRGVPLLERTLTMLTATPIIDRIVVSTDDREIAEIAVAAGADVPFLRPAEIADDHTGTRPVVQHAIRAWEETGRGLISELCTVYPAAVFVTPEDIIEAHQLLRETACEFVMSAAAYPAPVQRALQMDKDGRASMMWPAEVGTRSQDLTPAYHDAGQFYWGTRTAWLSDVPVMQADTRLHLIPHWRVQDIDTPEDWERAELLHRLIEERDQ